MPFRKIIHQLHLWLGIPAGLVVFVMAVTGCLYAFQDEIQNATQPFRFVKVSDKPFLPPSQLQAIALKSLPDKKLHSIKYNEAGKAVEAIFYHYEPTYYYTVYMNPSTGEVQKVNDNMAGFFRFVLNGHFYLWLPPAIGQPVIAVSTLVFLVLLITGIVLWMPKNWNALKYGLQIFWNRNNNWKRRNLELHYVFGIYVSLFALILTMTGLVWGFQWFAKGWYHAAGGEKSLTYLDPGSKKTETIRGDSTAIPLDKVWETMKKEYSAAKSIEIHPPENDTMSIAANANMGSGTYWKTDYRYFDQFTLKEIPVNHLYGRLKDARFADKLLRMNYDIHVGAIGGLPGKILVFLVGLFVASLPVTGYAVWWLRRKNSKTKAIESR